MDWDLNIFLLIKACKETLFEILVIIEIAKTFILIGLSSMRYCAFKTRYCWKYLIILSHSATFIELIAGFISNAIYHSIGYVFVFMTISGDFFVPFTLKTFLFWIILSFLLPQTGMSYRENRFDRGRDERLVDAIFSKHTNISQSADRPVDYEFLRKYL